MYINDIEDCFYINGVDGLDTGTLKLFLLLYADDITIFSETAEGLQKGLNILTDYCKTWKLTVNTAKSKIVVFRKGGQLPSNLRFSYDNSVIDIINSFSYLGLVFTPGGSFLMHKILLLAKLRKLFLSSTVIYTNLRNFRHIIG